MTGRIWTDERVQLLHTLHAKLKFGATDWRAAFAARLGVSRGALVGYLGREYRAGRMHPVPGPHPHDKGVGGRPRQGKGAGAGGTRPEPPPPTGEDEEVLDEARGLRHTSETPGDTDAPAGDTALDELARLERLRQLAQLGDLSLPVAAARVCQWPEWGHAEPRPLRCETARFCGAKPAMPGLSWCETHARACWGPQWRRRRQFAARILT